MDDAQFRQWAALLEHRTGLSISQTRRSFLATNIGLRMREVGCSDYQTYFELLRSGIRGHAEWSVLVDRLTVHETRFFRHTDSLSMLRERFLPELVARREAPYSVGAWSVGCATGEEAYSLAMLIEDFLEGAKPGFRYGVTATDISLPSLAVGRRGVYRERQLRELPARFRERYFAKLEATERSDTYEVVASVRARVFFSQLNVLELSRAPRMSMDIIYCQNLLIYFNRQRRMEILHGLTQRLAPGGLLVLGSGEVAGWSHTNMQRVPSQNTLAFQYGIDAAPDRTE
jgi:type IV pilus assembly protein PilK